MQVKFALILPIWPDKPKYIRFILCAKKSSASLVCIVHIQQDPTEQKKKITQKEKFPFERSNSGPLVSAISAIDWFLSQMK